MEEKNQEVAAQDTGRQVESSKAFDNRFAGQIDPSDIIMPLCILLQGNPTEREKYPNGQPGQFINNITQQPLPDLFIPLQTRKEWVRFNPRDEKHPDFDKAYAPNELMWKSKDANDPRVIAESVWRGTVDLPVPPLASAQIKIIAFFPGFNLPVMLSFMKTGYKSGKTLLTSIVAMSGSGEQMYRLQSIKRNENGNIWLVPNAFHVGPASDENAAKARAMYDMIAKARSVEVHEEDNNSQDN